MGTCFLCWNERVGAEMSKSDGMKMLRSGLIRLLFVFAFIAVLIVIGTGIKNERETSQFENFSQTSNDAEGMLKP